MQKYFNTSALFSESSSDFTTHVIYSPPQQIKTDNTLFPLCSAESRFSSRESHSHNNQERHGIKETHFSLSSNYSTTITRETPNNTTPRETHFSLSTPGSPASPLGISNETRFHR